LTPRIDQTTLKTNSLLGSRKLQEGLLEPFGEISLSPFLPLIYDCEGSVGDGGESDLQPGKHREYAERKRPHAGNNSLENHSKRSKIN